MTKLVELQHADLVYAVMGMRDGAIVFLGTGFFANPESPTLITALHVIQNTDRIGIALSGGMKDATVVRESTTHDLAFLHADFDPPHCLPIRREDVPTNLVVETFECSRTVVVNEDLGIVYSNRIGHIVRYMRSMRDGQFPPDSLELSFPALKGASGSPAIVHDTGEVCGVLVANACYDLEPVQTTVVEDGEVSETTHFYMPHGVAVHARHLADCLESIDG